jgi:hypothetical protein
MAGSWLDRWSGLAGIIAVVLLGSGAALFGVFEYLPSPEALGERLRDGNAVVSIGGYLGVVGAFFLIWFAGSLYRILRPREGGDGWLSTLVVGGGAAAGTVLAIGFSVIVASAARAGTGAGISSDEAVALYDLYSQVLGLAFAVAIAVHIAAVAALSLRTGVLPAWFSWVSVLIVVGLLSPFSYAALAAVLVWLVGMSLWSIRVGADIAD